MKRILTAFILSLLMITLAGCQIDKYTISYYSSVDNDLLRVYKMEKGATLHTASYITEVPEGYFYEGTYTEDGVKIDDVDVSVTSDTRLTVKYIPYTFYATYYEKDNTEYIKDITSYFRGLYVLTSNHRILAYGENNNGTLGTTTAPYDDIPHDITAQFQLRDGEIIDRIHAGSTTGVFISNEGRVFCLGSSAQRHEDITYREVTDITEMLQLENGEEIIDIDGYDTFIIITSLGRVIEFDYGTSDIYLHELTTLFDFDEGDKPLHIFYGSVSFVVTENGEIYSWGRNYYGQAGAISIDFTSPTWSDYDNNSKDYDIEEPLRITSNFDFNDSEHVIEIKTWGNSTFFVTNQGNVFVTGKLDIDNIFITGNDRYDQYTSLPDDITTHLGLQTHEKVEELHLVYNLVVFETTYDRRIGYGNFTNLFTKDYIEEAFFDFTTRIPFGIRKAERNTGVWTILDENNQLLIFGETEDNVLPLRSLGERTYYPDLTSCEYYYKRNSVDCVRVDDFMNVTTYLPLGYKIINSEAFYYNDTYQIDPKWKEYMESYDLSFIESYPMNNLYLIE